MSLHLSDLKAPEEEIFCVTFGVKWRHEEHPQKMSPDGFVVIHALTEKAARTKAFELFGDEWGFIYDHLDRQHPERFKEESYPLGIIGFYTA
jgi:hypothetical protein